jgi:hypothetical protein
MMRVPGRIEDGMVLYLHIAKEILTLETPSPSEREHPRRTYPTGATAALSSTAPIASASPGHLQLTQSISASRRSRD